MNRVPRILQILVIVTISLGALLLGMSQGDFEPLLITVVASVSAWILVDVIGWFRLPQWLANLIAIVVTIFTVTSFFDRDDAVRQLLGVGKLLIYLQAILLFQEKSARVYWQVMVLSLLQVVVGAVFNLGFEGGVLFIVYMMFAGLTMLMLHLYQQQQIVRRQTTGAAGPAAAQGMLARIEPASQPAVRASLGSMMRHYAVMGLGVLFFGIVLFYFLPRENSSWAGPNEVDMRPTGYLQKVSLNHPERIPMSTNLVMTVKYKRRGTESSWNPLEDPYLRGMALSNLVIEDNETTWVAPTSQIRRADFSGLGDASRINNIPWVIQEVVLEPTDDPLLYSPVPAMAVESQLDQEIEYCWPLGGLTRQRSDDKITLAHFRYSLAIPLQEENGAFFEAWAYRPRSGRVLLTEQEDPGNWRWLTYLDRSRYPEIVAEADNLANQPQMDNPYRLAKSMEQFFATVDNGFSYTVDFRDVSRDRSIDAVEDFFANHRTGHCSYFASALALMLRSQGIPARVVVGYRGGVLNDFGDHLDVESRHAHAWVEAYIPPRHLPDRLKATRQAGRLGSWIRLDATPSIDHEELLTSNALNYAKSFWRDYVLGLQADTGATVISPDGIRLSGFLRLLDLGWWQTSVSGAVTRSRVPGTWQHRLWQVLPWLLLVLAGIAGWLWYRRRQRVARTPSTRRSTRTRPTIRQRISRLASGLAPGFANWLDPPGGRVPPVPFYARLTRMLHKAGWQRPVHRTPMEFATDLGTSLSTADGREIGFLTERITDFYYLVRFGARELTPPQQEEVQQLLDRLESLLRPTGRPDPPAVNERD